MTSLETLKTIGRFGLDLWKRLLIIPLLVVVFLTGSKSQVVASFSTNYMGVVMLLIMRFHVLYTCGVWLIGS